MSAPRTRGEFVRRLWEAVAHVEPQWKRAPMLMTIAHAAYESGWGSARGARVNNYFNLQRGHWKNGVYRGAQRQPLDIEGPDQEYLDDQTVIDIIQLWRGYPTVVDGVIDYFTFISAPRYGLALTQLSAGHYDFIRSLSKGRYFTLPLDQYMTAYEATLTQVQKEAAELGLTPEVC